MKHPIKYTLAIMAMLVPVLLIAQPAGTKALRMNGSSNYVNCGSMNLSGSAITIQGWINVQAFKSTFPYITSFAGIEQTGSHCAIRIGDASIPNDRVQFILYIGGSYYKLHSSQALTSNAWYHIAASYDGAQMKIYINGQLDTLKNQSGSIVANNTFELGRNYDNTRILNGDLDEVSVFSTALSEGTIRQWMCRKITPQHPNYAQLLAYWPLAEGTGTSTADASGNGNTGTLVGNPQWRNSAAPVGDVSKFVYANSFSIGIAHPAGDSIHFTSTGGSFEGVHIYRVDSVPYVTTAPSPLQYLDTGRYWGIFPIGSAQFDATYYYNGNATLSGLDCFLTFASREDGYAAAWSVLNPSSVNYTNQELSFSASNREEIIAAVSSNGPHNFAFEVDPPLCMGDSNGTVTVTISGGQPPYSYAWQNGSSTAQSSGHAAGYAVLSITDNNNCTSTDSVMVTEPTAVGTFISTTPSLCKDTNTGTALVVASGGAGNYSYQWNDPAGSLSYIASQLYPGNFMVTVSDSNGCSTTAQATVASTGPDPQPWLGPDTNICTGIVFGMSAGAIGGPYTQYAWSTGNTTGIQIVTNPGTYSLTVHNAQGCSGSDTVVVQYVEPILVNLGPASQTAEQSLVLDAGTGFLSYQWNTLANTQSIVVNQSSTYWVKVRDSNQCKSADTVVVTILPMGISETSARGVKIYPNPTHAVLNIAAPSALLDFRWSVVDAVGRVVLSGLSNGALVLDVSSLSAGLYHALITFPEGEFHTMKFVKK